MMTSRTFSPPAGGLEKSTFSQFSAGRKFLVNSIGATKKRWKMGLENCEMGKGKGQMKSWDG
jgi:hypothetical protein